MGSTARAPLSRDRIVATALALIDADGPEKLSMRRLGQALGVDPMAIYYHVPHKAALHDAIIEHLWESVTVPAPAPGETWQSLLLAVFGDVAARLRDHPRAVVILGTRPSVTPPLLRLIDSILGRLAALGLAGQDAMQLIDCLCGYTIGKVLAEVGDAPGGPAPAVPAALTTVTPQTHPHLVAALQAGYEWAPDVEFDRGLRALVHGWA